LLTAVNTGITVAGIAVPLIAGLAAYGYSVLLQSTHDLAYLVAGLIISCLSVASGLWAAFSIATISDAAGTIKVSKAENLYVGSNLVFQLLTLVSGCLLIAAYVFSLQPKLREISEFKDSGRPAIQRRHIFVGESATDIEHAWGEPDSRKSEASGFIYNYGTPSSLIDVRIENDVAVQISERLR
jgi:hypothetical protein